MEPNHSLAYIDFLEVTSECSEACVDQVSFMIAYSLCRNRKVLYDNQT